MKNYMEQFKISVVENASVYSSSTTLSAVTDLKVLKINFMILPALLTPLLR